MKLLSLKKYHINTNKVSKSLSDILSITRRRTSKIIKFWKHLWQIARERIPLLSPIHELTTGKWFVSEVKIVKRSVSWRGRITIIITESIFAISLLLYGRSIIGEAKTNITNIIFHKQFPDHLSIETVILMIALCIGTIAYYGMIKPGDFKQAIKEHKEEWH